MAITHTFKGSTDSYGYGYFGYIEDGQLVLGETWPREGGVTYRGTYEGAKGHLAELKTKAVRLYNSIEKYFSKHDPDCLCNKPITAGDLKPGAKFKYDGVEYIAVDFKPSECFVSGAFPGIVCALSLATYKVVCLDKTWEVALII